MSEVAKSSITTLVGETRELCGTGSSRALRLKGMIPCVIYGKSKKNAQVALQEKEVTKLYRNGYFTSTPIRLSVEDKLYDVLPKSVQLNPVTDLVSHVDFVYLENKTQRLYLPIKFDGKENCLSIKRGGFFNVVNRYVEVECPSSSIPQFLVLDISNVKTGESIRASKINLPDNVKLLCKRDIVVASIIGSKGAKDEQEAEAAA